MADMTQEERDFQMILTTDWWQWILGKVEEYEKHAISKLRTKTDLSELMRWQGRLAGFKDMYTILCLKAPKEED